MCEQCVSDARAAKVAAGEDDTSLGRVFSIEKLSTVLVDAFMASDGAHKAVAVVDPDGSIYELYGVDYDADKKLIKLQIRYSYRDLRNYEVLSEIAAANQT